MKLLLACVMTDCCRLLLCSWPRPLPKMVRDHGHTSDDDLPWLTFDECSNATEVSTHVSKYSKLKSVRSHSLPSLYRISFDPLSLLS
jgi:hypothetical protein